MGKYAANMPQRPNAIIFIVYRKSHTVYVWDPRFTTIWMAENRPQ